MLAGGEDGGGGGGGGSKGGRARLLGVLLGLGLPFDLEREVYGGLVRHSWSEGEPSRSNQRAMEAIE